MNKTMAALAAFSIVGVIGLSACSDQPATVASKYNCTKVVNGQTTPAYCVQDSNGNNFYLNYWIWRQVVLGHPVTSYEPQRFWDNTNHEAADDHVPASEHQGAHDSSFGHDFGGEGEHGGFGGEGHGGFSGGHGGR